MPNLNSVQLMGNCTRDPEVKFTPKGTAVAQFSLAINRSWKNEAGQKQEETTFIDVEMFGRIAEIAGEYLKKGKPVFVSGRLKLDSWDDKQSGQKRSKMKVIGEQLQLLGSRDDGGQREERPAQRQSEPPQRRPAAPPPRPPVDPDLDSNEDSIPF